MKNSTSGFTLIELLFVIAIIAILATLGIPYYQKYVIKAKLVEVEHAMVKVESAVSSYCQENGDSWPNCPTINEIRNSLGIGLAAVTRISLLSIDSATGVITATVSNIDSMVNGKTITLTPKLNADGSLSWVWGCSADFPPQFRPKSESGSP